MVAMETSSHVDSDMSYQIVARYFLESLNRVKEIFVIPNSTPPQNRTEQLRKVLGDPVRTPPTMLCLS